MIVILLFCIPVNG